MYADRCDRYNPPMFGFQITVLSGVVPAVVTGYIQLGPSYSVDEK